VTDGGKNRNTRIHTAHDVRNPNTNLHGAIFRRAGIAYNTTQPLSKKIIAYAMSIGSNLPEAGNGAKNKAEKFIF
jgi:hypothetical protein